MEKTVARNEPCPCGSGKKYKRCHGMEAAPQVSVPATPKAAPAAGMPPGFDPSQVDPQAMMQVVQAMQRLPRSQQQKLQSLVQRAMAGKDVAREMAEFERTLPPNFQNIMQSLAPQLMPGMMQQMAQAQGAASPTTSELSEEEAKRIVAEAAKSGKISTEEAQNLLGAEPEKVLEEAESRKSGLSRFFKRAK